MHVKALIEVFYIYIYIYLYIYIYIYINQSDVQVVKVSWQFTLHWVDTLRYIGKKQCIYNLIAR